MHLVDVMCDETSKLCAFNKLKRAALKGLCTSFHDASDTTSSDCSRKNNIAS